MPTLMAALPRDIDRRAELLDAVAAVVPKFCPQLQAVLDLRAHLDAHIVAQRGFVFDRTGDERGSGRLGDHPLERGSGRMGDDSRERGIAKGGRR